jgi:hypothetical protein
MKRLFVVAASAAVLVAAGASGAFAGEVKGPPGTPCGGDTGITCEHSTNDTGAPDNANSNCAYSGLNDMDPEAGQTSSITQTPHDVPVPGVAGHGACAGGTNEGREEQGNRPTP